MTKHKKAFRDNYLAAIISTVAMLLSICVQAQKKYQPYPTPGQAKWWMADSTSHIPYGPMPSLRGGDLRPGALFYVTSSSGDTSVYSWTGERWKKEGGTSNAFDTTYQIKFSPVAFERRWVYSYSDSIYNYYNDSISIRGENGIANGKVWGRFDDSTGFFYHTLQRTLDAGGGINKRNWLNFNGYKFNWDSIGAFNLSVKAFTDTAFSIIRGGGLNLLTVRNSDGYTVVHNFITNSGNVSINNATGMTISNSYLRMGSGSRIISENGPLIIERSRIPGSGGGLQGLIITNDTLGLPGTADSSTLSLLEVQYRNYNNNLRDPKVKVFADGSIWIPYTPYVSAVSVDSLLAIKNGKVVKVLKSDVSGGGGSVDSTVYTTLLRDMQRLDSITKYRNIPASFTSSSSITVDYISRARFIGTISHNAAFTISNMHAGEVVFYIITGSGGPYTATFPGGFQPVLKPNTGDTTMVIGSWNGSAWYWSTNYANSPAIVSVSSSSTLNSPASLGTTVLTNCSGGAVTHTLPSASSNTGLIYRLKKTDSSGNAMSVTTTEGTQSITTQYAGLVIQSTGSAWVIIGMF